MFRNHFFFKRQYTSQNPITDFGRLINKMADNDHLRIQNYRTKLDPKTWIEKFEYTATIKK